MKLFTILFLLTTAIFTINAQTIETKKGFGGTRFFQNGEKLKLWKVIDLMESDPETLKLIQSAQSHRIGGNVIGFVGGFLVGRSLGKALRAEDNELDWRMLTVGFGVTIVSFSFNATYNRKARKAVDIYNAQFDSSSLYSPNLQFKFEANVNRVGIMMSF